MVSLLFTFCNGMLSILFSFADETTHLQSYGDVIDNDIYSDDMDINCTENQHVCISDQTCGKICLLMQLILHLLLILRNALCVLMLLHT